MTRKLLSSTLASHTLGTFYVLAQLASYEWRKQHTLAEAAAA